MKYYENYNLRDLNTFGLDVKTEKFLAVNSAEEIEEFNKTNKIDLSSTLILGSGSNILFKRDFNGLIIKPDIFGIKVIEKNESYVKLEVGSGVIWDDLVTYAVERNYGGIENLALIPGTVGAAPIQNIGAYGVEFEEVFLSLEAINLENLELEVFDKSRCNFGYRESIFKNELKNKYIITKVTIELNLEPKLNTSYRAFRDYLKNYKKSELTISDVSRIVKEIRNSKLPDPLEIGNAGSFFKNPIIDKKHFDDLKKSFKDLVYFEISPVEFKIPAGWLIEKSGLKGRRIRDVGVHDKQALVLVNYGNGTGEELVDLSEEIKALIYKKFNINLETEVNIV